MVPRVRVEAVESTDTVEALVALASRTGHSRFPVAGEDLDDVLGVVHVKSVHGVPVEDRATTLVTELMTPVPAVPESRDLDELLVDLRQGGNQLRSSSTSTVAAPGSSPSRTSSRRSWGRSTTSTTMPRRC